MLLTCIYIFVTRDILYRFLLPRIFFLRLSTIYISNVFFKFKLTRRDLSCPNMKVLFLGHCKWGPKWVNIFWFFSLKIGNDGEVFGPSIDLECIFLPKNIIQPFRTKITKYNDYLEIVFKD